MKLFKKIFFPLLFIIIYISLLITVFIGNTDIADIGTTLWLQLLLIILWLLAIQTIPLSSKKVLFWLITVFGFTRSLLALLTNNIQHAIFIACTHLIFLVYTWERFHLIHSSKSFYLWRSAHRWLWSTSILLAVTYIGTLRWTSTWLNLDCNRLHDQTIWLIKQYIPNMQNNTGLLMVVDKIDNFSTQSFGQLLGIDTTLSWTSLWENTHPIDLTTLLSWTNVSLLSWWYLSLSSWTWQLTWQSHNVWVLWSLLWYQQNLLNGIINNQELIDAQVCNVTLTHINTIAQNNDIKLIAFVLLILWLSFFMRSIMFIIGVINFILLRLLFTTWWLKKTIIQEDCEQIDV